MKNQATKLYRTLLCCLRQIIPAWLECSLTVSLSFAFTCRLLLCLVCHFRRSRLLSSPEHIPGLSYIPTPLFLCLCMMAWGSPAVQMITFSLPSRCFAPHFIIQHVDTLFFVYFLYRTQASSSWSLAHMLVIFINKLTFLVYDGYCDCSSLSFRVIAILTCLN